MRYPVRAIPRVESQRNKPRLQGGTECDKLETPGLCEIGVLRAERKARNRRNLFESRRHLARFQTNRHFGGASLIASAPEVQREPISQQPLIFWFFCIKTKERTTVRFLPQRLFKCSVVIRFVTCLLLLATSPIASAQRATLNVQADSLSIGEVFEIHVTVEHQPGVRVLFDNPGHDVLHSEPIRAGDAELIALHRLPPEDRNGTRIDAARYSATTFALDDARIGPLEVGLIIGRDTSRIHVPGIVLPVRSFVDPDSTAIFGPAPPANFARGLWPWLVAFFAALALAATALFGMRWWRNRRKANVPLEPLDEAHQTLQA